MPFAILPPAKAQDGGSLPALEEAALRAAAESVANAVVQIRTIGGLDTAGGRLLADGPTTGLVISADGYIVSSAFNFVQQPASILITLPSGRQAPAEMVATDHSRMLVLLKVTGAADLAVPIFAPADEIRPGQWSIAVGRTFRSDQINVSVGIVSAIGRMYGKVIQTDASVSTANYGGPLVDVRGRVLGIIVPMAPQGASEVAGVEWYDSGIGFAVPLAPLAERLERMKNGQDQRPGILGIGMAQRNPHASPAELAAVRPDAPAGQAGLKKGDRITEIDGRPIRTQTDLRFALGPRYGGETIRIIAKRGDERLERSITLASELPAFRHAFIGVLPLRQAEPTPDDPEAAQNEGGGKVADVIVRMVYDGSPAAKAGIKSGDRLTAIDETAVESLNDALGAMNNLAPGNEIQLKLRREDQSIEVTLTAAQLPTTVPSELPPAYAPADEPAVKKDTADNGGGETSDLKLPEFPHECKVYVPASHAQGRPQGALLWLHASGESSADDIIDRWRPICDRDSLLLIVPSAAEDKQWERTELEYLQRLTERFIGQYKIDRNRVVVYGEGSGGAMAWLLALSGRDAFRGVATSAAPLPRQIRVPPNEPAQRLAIFAVTPASKDAAAQIADGFEKLSKAGYNVTTISAAPSGQLSEDQRSELARWIDTLDRF